jgi:hypothetical protein
MAYKISMCYQARDKGGAGDLTLGEKIAMLLKALLSRISLTELRLG